VASREGCQPCEQQDGSVGFGTTWRRRAPSAAPAASSRSAIPLEAGALIPARRWRMARVWTRSGLPGARAALA